LVLMVNPWTGSKLLKTPFCNSLLEKLFGQQG
jgi:hypothetical protein